MVAQALAEMRVAIAEQEERARQEAERKRKELEARQRADLEARKRLEEQRRAEERRRQEEERRKREAEQQRRQREVATLLISVERALAENRPEDATVLLKQADAVGAVGTPNSFIVSPPPGPTRSEQSRTPNSFIVSPPPGPTRSNVNGNDVRSRRTSPVRAS
jgi:hypothetical protein